MHESYGNLISKQLAEARARLVAIDAEKDEARAAYARDRDPSNDSYRAGPKEMAMGRKLDALRDEEKELLPKIATLERHLTFVPFVEAGLMEPETAILRAISGDTMTGK